MATKAEKQIEAPAQPDNSNFPITLQEFCTRISVTDKRVELIGAFYTTKLAAGVTNAVQADFAAMLNEFANQPA